MLSKSLPATFPLAAIQGQSELVRALLLAAIDPAIGGVLIQGPRGTAKTTAARALAQLLAPAPFVTLPLGASMEHLVGSLNLSKVLANGEVAFAPGILARAHGGVLYVDEINLLPDALVDVLLDAGASGINHVERDGISHSHAARFILIGTMNPEEGALRPQLLDRLGLCVQLENPQQPQLRSAIVASRLHFEQNPEDFQRAYAARQKELTVRLHQARARCADHQQLPWSQAIHEAVAEHCIAAAVDGLRGDLVLLRAARALAAWQGSACISEHHVSEVAALALQHRKATGAQQHNSTAATPQGTQAMQSPQDASPPMTAPPAASDFAGQEFSCTSETDGGSAQGMAQPPADWGRPQSLPSTPICAAQADAIARAALEALAAKKARAPGPCQ